MSRPAAAEASSTGSAALRRLTPTHKRLVRESFDLVSPAAGLLARAFYRRLFEIAPETRAMFPGDMAGLEARLVTALRLAVASLDRLDDIVPALRLLGASNRSRGMEPVHYGFLGEALLWTLANALGPRFTPECRDAWVAAFTVMAEVMTAPGQ